MANKETIYAVNAGLEYGSKFKLCDASHVLHTHGTAAMHPVLYDTQAAALSAGTTLFAVGETYRSVGVAAIEPLADRLELTLN